MKLAANHLSKVSKTKPLQNAMNLYVKTPTATLALPNTPTLVHNQPTTKTANELLIGLSNPKKE